MLAPGDDELRDHPSIPAGPMCLLPDSGLLAHADGTALRVYDISTDAERAVTELAAKVRRPT